MKSNLIVPSRRALLAGLAGLGGAGLLSACGSSASVAGSVPSPSAGGSGAAQPGASARPADLPTDPERVVAMYATDADYCLVLGLPLVGSYSTSATDFPPYQADRLSGVQPLVTFPEPSYEQIAALRPDLVFHGAASYSPDQVEPLQAIAPLFAFDDRYVDSPDWRATLREAAAVFDRVGEAEEFVAAHDARAEELRARTAERWDGASFAYMGPIEPGVFYVAQANMQTNLTLVEDLGLTLADAVPATVEERRTDISYEEMSMLADADIIIVRTNPREGTVDVDTEATEQITGSPLWPGLPAVQAGNVRTISGDLFYTSPLTAQANLDWAEQQLLA
ncbi:ABC transporter substrate-binding protein [Jannaschia sp. R86511]|uniref:ABC transporter substrate-binding protein n=1 Tax=Jannaschia sp. R86511 TaxID=3093853 RepID=UPI0036D2443C